MHSKKVMWSALNQHCVRHWNPNLIKVHNHLGNIDLTEATLTFNERKHLESPSGIRWYNSGHARGLTIQLVEPNFCRHAISGDIDILGPGGTECLVEWLLCIDATNHAQTHQDRDGDHAEATQCPHDSNLHESPLPMFGEIQCQRCQIQCGTQWSGKARFFLPKSYATMRQKCRSYSKMS